MSIAWVRVRSAGIDVSIVLGILMFIWGVKLANVCRELLLVRRVDMSIAWVRVRSVGVDVSIVSGILMFIWGVNSANVCRELLLVRRVDMSTAWIRVRSVGVDVSLGNTDFHMGGKFSECVSLTFISPTR